MNRTVLHARVISGSWGGPDKTILNSPRFLGDRYPMVCAYMRHPDDAEFVELEELAERCGTSVVAVDDFGPTDRRVLDRFARLCAEHQPGIWHGHDYKSNVVGLWLKRRFPALRLVTTVHGWVKRTWKTPLYYAIDKWSLPKYARVLCVSDDLYKASLRAGVSERRCQLLPNGIDTEQFRRTLDPSAARSGWLETNRSVVGAVGRLSPEKGFDRLVRAVAQLGPEFDVELWIAGEGDQRASLEGLAADLGISERVRLLGFQGDTVRLFQAMDVFALSSLREGLPNVVLEAMALEVPVVATRIAEVPEVIEHGETGWLVQPDSVEELKEGLTRALTRSQESRAMARRARRTIEERYSFRTRMARVAAVYDEVLAAGSSV